MVRELQINQSGCPMAAAALAGARKQSLKEGSNSKETDQDEYQKFLSTDQSNASRNFLQPSPSTSTRSSPLSSPTFTRAIRNSSISVTSSLELSEFLTSEVKQMRRSSIDHTSFATANRRSSRVLMPTNPTPQHVCSFKQFNPDESSSFKTQVFLYEQYISLPVLRDLCLPEGADKWPLSSVVQAGFQATELQIQLLIHFCKDKRLYSNASGRISVVSDCLVKQLSLLASLFDEDCVEEFVVALSLEEKEERARMNGIDIENKNDYYESTSQEYNDNQEYVEIDTSFSRTPLLNDFASENTLWNELLELIEIDRGGCVGLKTLKKHLRGIIHHFSTCFDHFSYYIGIEPTLIKICKLLEINCPFQLDKNKKFMDYEALVNPLAISSIQQTFDHFEDFFFRTVHLGTECWAHIASIVSLHIHLLSKHRMWNQACDLVDIASSIMDYTGDHIQMLMRMNLRDYLVLKQGIEGTSGAASVKVVSLLNSIRKLFEPIKKEFQLVWERTGDKGENNLTKKIFQDLSSTEKGAILVYLHPEKFSGLYSYCQGLEYLEARLLGGFYFKHFQLAKTVLGTGAKGTMNRSVTSLTSGFNKKIFPIFDTCRTLLGEIFDQDSSFEKGAVLNKAAEVDFSHLKELNEIKDFSRSIASSCPMLSSYGRSPEGSPTTKLKTLRRSLTMGQRQAQYYGWQQVPSVYKDATQALFDSSKTPKLAFQDHAWGQIPPFAHYNSTLRLFSMYQLGNAHWDELFGTEIPLATKNVQKILNLPETSRIAFGHNTHDLVVKLISTLLDDHLAKPSEKIKMLVSDQEFYSLSRQIKRFQSFLEVTKVPVEPQATFVTRYLKTAKEQESNILYCSQVTFKRQQTLIEDIDEFVVLLKNKELSDLRLTIIDGYHAFGAFPVDLANICDDIFYIGGFLKHVASGANCCFVTLPSTEKALTPAITGWLSDPNWWGESEVYGTTQETSPYVDFSNAQPFMTSTPAFGPSLVLFNRVINWQQRNNIDVKLCHSHILKIHRHFLKQLEKIKSPIFNLTTMTPIDEFNSQTRSHTLTFDFTEEKEVDVGEIINFLKEEGIAIDERENCCRIGFGYNHKMSDVDELCAAISRIKVSSRKAKAA